MYILYLPKSSILVDGILQTKFRGAGPGANCLQSMRRVRNGLKHIFCLRAYVVIIRESSP